VLLTKRRAPVTVSPDDPEIHALVQRLELDPL